MSSSTGKGEAAPASGTASRAVATLETRAGELVNQAKRLRDEAEELLRLAVAAERSLGTSWEDVGQELGVSRSAAHSRFSSFVQELDGQSRAQPEDPEVQRSTALERLHQRWLSVEEIVNEYAAVEGLRSLSIVRELRSPHDEIGQHQAAASLEASAVLHADGEVTRSTRESGGSGAAQGASERQPASDHIDFKASTFHGSFASRANVDVPSATVYDVDLMQRLELLMPLLSKTTSSHDVGKSVGAYSKLLRRRLAELSSTGSCFCLKCRQEADASLSSPSASLEERLNRLESLLDGYTNELEAERGAREALEARLTTVESRFTSAPSDSHAGEHLAILWDDPTRLVAEGESSEKKTVGAPSAGSDEGIPREVR
ncbi:hypothetical protein [Streptomyces sp. NPDC057257]|uniref:hypothetical protein n=1 Tax=Streptomyces sp. NPDC057257 TaxID=3346071 RepID=UPI00362A1F52